MKSKLPRVFSSAADLEGQDEVRYVPIRRTPELAPGQDLLFDRVTGEPLQPRPKTLMKAFSGSTLDLDEGAATDAAHGPDDFASPVQIPASRFSPSTAAAASVGSMSNVVSPAALAPRPAAEFTAAAAAPVPPAATPIVGSAADGSASLASTLPSVAGTTVLVFGGAGFLGGHVVRGLLQRGYNVRCALEDERDAGARAELFHLSREHEGRLSVVEANPLSAPSVLDAVRRSGCRYIVYCGLPASAVAAAASPAECYGRAAQALFDSIRAVRAAAPHSIERVVVTGSTAALAHPNDDPPADAPNGFNETHRNVRSTPKDDPVGHARARFEEEVWRLGGLVHVDVAVVIPALMLGPTLTGASSEAVRLLQEHARPRGHGLLAFRSPFVADMWWNFVDVRDVAMAHVRALEAPAACNRRLIVTNRLCSVAELCRTMARLDPALDPPRWTLPRWATLVASLFVPGLGWAFLRRHLGRRRPLDGTLARRVLGLEPTPLDATVAACLSEMRDQAGLLRLASGPAGAASAAGGVTAAQVEEIGSPGPLSEARQRPGAARAVAGQTSTLAILVRAALLAGIASGAVLAYSKRAAVRA